MYIVYIWSKIDNLVRDVLSEYIEIECLSRYTKIPNINLPIGVFALMDNERRYFIISQIEQKLDIPLKQGVGKFESILKVFDLGGPIPGKLKDALFELSNVRNIIVHNNSVADERFVINCPWMGYSVGRRLKLSRDCFYKYSQAVFDYTMLITFRFRNEPIDDIFIENWIDLDSN